MSEIWLFSLIAAGFLLVLAAGIFIFLFWIFMLIDSIKRNFKSDAEKIIWVLVIILTGLLGAIIYYFAVKREDSRGISEKSTKKRKR